MILYKREKTGTRRYVYKNSKLNFWPDGSFLLDAERTSFRLMEGYTSENQPLIKRLLLSDLEKLTETIDLLTIDIDKLC